MTDKELIKQEIERRIDEICEDGFVLKENQQEYETLTDLEDFIDSLPEESGCEVNFTTKNKDLEEAAKNFIINEFPPHVTSDNDADVESAYNRAIDTFIAGAEWQKKKMKETLQTEYEKGRFDMMDEMMKDAVDGIVHHFNGDKLAAIHYNDPKGTPMSIYVSSKGLSAGDKVKIIIVKTEQQ